MQLYDHIDIIDTNVKRDNNHIEYNNNNGNGNNLHVIHLHIIHQNPYKYLYYYIETECS